MLDIGGWEFLVVAFVLVMVVGPKELPKMLRGFTGIMRQIRRAANEFTSSMTDLANEADMADLKKTLDQAKSGNLDEIADAIDPTGGVGETVGSLKVSIGKDAAGDDVKDIGTIAKEAGDEMAAATKSPEAEPASQTAKKAKS
jgi:sec-independent protein translocase protein TatB